MTLDDVEFDRIVQLLIRLQQAGIAPLEVDLRRAQQPGRVAAQLRLDVSGFAR